MSGSPSSPFDNISPWKDIKRVTDSFAGELVEIPKFYFKWTKDGSKMKLQISMTKHNGFFTSPAHSDRGDGIGERDYIYVGRYKCASDYKSKTGVTPKNYNTRSQFVSGIHSLGSNVYIWDYLVYCTICMLYLVEYANFNSQAMIGYGCSVSGSRMNTGYTDVVPYHTGTQMSARTTYGGTQYRYIEGLWDNIHEYFGGINTPDTTSLWIEKNPNNFADGQIGINLGTISYPYHGLAHNFKFFDTSGFEGIFWPDNFESFPDGSSSVNSYICDDMSSYGGKTVMRYSNYNQCQNYGMFSLYGNNVSGSYTSDPNIGSRLMVLPPSRLSA